MLFHASALLRLVVSHGACSADIAVVALAAPGMKLPHPPASSILLGLPCQGASFRQLARNGRAFTPSLAQCLGLTLTVLLRTTRYIPAASLLLIHMTAARPASIFTIMIIASTGLAFISDSITVFMLHDDSTIRGILRPLWQR